MKGKALIPLVAGLCIGGFALKIGFDTVKRAKGSQGETVQVWAARMDIPRNTEIKEDMLTPLSFPPKLVPAGAFKEKKDLVGRVPRIEAPAGLPVLNSMLLPPGTLAGLHVKPGYRAVAVKVDESSGVDNHLQPGCFVDVVGYFKVRRGNKQETIARTLIENVEVAAVGQRLSPGTGEGTADGKAKPARAVTLLLQPFQVPDLLLAEQRGKIKLSMRNQADTGRVSKAVLTTEGDVLGLEKPAKKTSPLGGLFDAFKKKAEAQTPVVQAPQPQPTPKLPAGPPPWTMVIYNGDMKQVLAFKDADSMEPALPVVLPDDSPQKKSTTKKEPQQQPQPDSPDIADFDDLEDPEDTEPKELQE